MGLVNRQIIRLGVCWLGKMHTQNWVPLGGSGDVEAALQETCSVDDADPNGRDSIEKISKDDDSSLQKTHIDEHTQFIHTRPKLPVRNSLIYSLLSPFYPWCSTRIDFYNFGSRELTPGFFLSVTFHIKHLVPACYTSTHNHNHTPDLVKGKT